MTSIIQCCYYYTVLLLLYSAAIIIQCCYYYTVLLLLYSAAIIIQCCYYYTVLLLLYSAAIIIQCCYYYTVLLLFEYLRNNSEVCYVSHDIIIAGSFGVVYIIILIKITLNHFLNSLGSVVVMALKTRDNMTGTSFLCSQSQLHAGFHSQPYCSKWPTQPS